MFKSILIPTDGSILTARADRIAGLNAGADECIVKPIDLDELAARLRAVERRAAGRAEPQFTIGSLAIDPSGCCVTQGGLPVDLTPREFAVLMGLAKRPGAIVEPRSKGDGLRGKASPDRARCVPV
jgi:DNA-binding response OmpR family regulator